MAFPLSVSRTSSRNFIAYRAWKMRMCPVPGSALLLSARLPKSTAGALLYRAKQASAQSSPCVCRSRLKKKQRLQLNPLVRLIVVECPRNKLQVCGLIAIQGWIRVRMPEKPHVLVAADERRIRLTLEAGLSVKGFRVTCVRSGRDALEAARRPRFDAVLSDIYMPDGDGLEVVRELRGAISTEIPIILITAQGSVETAVRAVAEGVSDFIAKPFEIAELATLLHRH